MHTVVTVTGTVVGATYGTVVTGALVTGGVLVGGVVVGVAVLAGVVVTGVCGTVELVTGRPGELLFEPGVVVAVGEPAPVVWVGVRPCDFVGDDEEAPVVDVTVVVTVVAAAFEAFATLAK